MSDFSAWAIAATFASAFAPWYVVAVTVFGVVVSLVIELP